MWVQEITAEYEIVSYGRENGEGLGTTAISEIWEMRERSDHRAVEMKKS